MVNVAGETEASSEPRGQEEMICMRVALSHCTYELLCFKYAALNPHIRTCACISMGAAVLCVQTNISRGDFLFCSS